MNPNPKSHPFTPKYLGAAGCKWCSFHKNAHREPTASEKAERDRIERIETIKEAQSGS